MAGLLVLPATIQTQAEALVRADETFSRQPTVGQALEQRLVADDPEGTNQSSFGTAIDIDGDTAVIGAPGDKAVYVFEHSGNTWIKTATLRASWLNRTAGIGRSVAIDGDTIVAGASSDEVDGELAQGAVYVFDRVGAPDRQPTARLTALDGGTSDYLGTSVAIEGDVIVAGAIGDDNTDDARGAHEGAVYTFSTTGGAERTETGKLVASNPGFDDQLGRSVAIDGDTIVSGAPNADLNRGAVYTFGRSGPGVRTQTAKLSASDTFMSLELGRSVAIDGDTIVVGAPSDYSVDEVNRLRYHGAVYTFTRAGAGGRNETARLTASDAAADQDDQLGYSVAIQGDTILSGALRAANFRGSAYTFARTGPLERTETGKLTPPVGTGQAHFGAAVAIDGDATMVGASGGAPDGVDYEGSAWAYFSAVQTSVDLSISKTDLADRVEPGFEIVYDLAVTNNSGVAGTDVQATDVLPAGVSYSPSNSDASCTEGPSRTITCDFGSVAPGATETARIAVGAEQVGTITNTARVAGEDPDPNPGNNQDTETTVVAMVAPDTTPPQTTITSGPANGATITTTTPTFSFTSNEPGSMFLCQVDDDYRSCTSPTRIGPLVAGTHTFEVQATDAAGNLDDTTAIRTFTVNTGGSQPPPTDTRPPQTFIDAGPKSVVRTRKQKVAAKFTVRSSEPGSTFECSLDGARFVTCSAHPFYTVTRGKHVLKVRATDRAGNTDASPAAHTWTVKRPRT